MRTTLTLLNETSESEERTRNTEMEKRFNRLYGARRSSYQMEELVWARDYNKTLGKKVGFQLASRNDMEMLYDVLTEEGQLRRHANQTAEDKSLQPNSMMML
ncbi:hypothetical protein GCK32_017011 [Trichostrongylus colubriformis]|uniref:Uncharacterized protein n=1 Tax=Trichostrongylus colubriformis TaxID=6319 RepID=A0AAN8EVQ5_TRICO